MAAPIAVPGPVAQVVDGLVRGPRGRVVGATASSAKPENIDQPHRRAARLVRRRTRGLPSAPRPTGSGCRSVEHIDPDSSRARMIDVLSDRHVRGDLRPGRRHREQGEAGQQQGDRQVATPARPAGQRGAQAARGSNR